MKEDPEITAMAKLKEVLDPLDDETRAHVIRWANSRFAGILPKTIGAEAEQDENEMFKELGAFFDAARPRTAAERALVVGYWLQEIKGNDSFESATVNSELRNLGHSVTNITRAFDDLKRMQPAMAMQVHKSGKSKQARKKYKITNAGINKVRDMITKETEDL